MRAGGCSPQPGCGCSLHGLLSAAAIYAAGMCAVSVVCLCTACCHLHYPTPFPHPFPSTGACSRAPRLTSAALDMLGEQPPDRCVKPPHAVPCRGVKPSGCCRGLPAVLGERLLANVLLSARPHAPFCRVRGPPRRQERRACSGSLPGWTTLLVGAPGSGNCWTCTARVPTLRV